MTALAQRSWRRLLPSIGSSQGVGMSARTLYALSSLLLSVQLPHLLNLPIWVSAIGMTLVAGRLALLRYPANSLLRTALSPLSVTLLAAACALLIKWHYGYFLGRDPGVAFLFILVAAKFAEVRRAKDATLLLCLCAFLLLTQYFYSQTIISALVTIPAVLALGHSLAVLRDADNPETTLAQLKVIGVLLLQGLPLAAVLFIVFPRLPGPMWSLPEDGMASSGLSDSMSPGTISQLSQSSAVAFRVEFDGDIPESNQLYWRGPVLTDFDGRNWNVSRTNLNTIPQYDGPEERLVQYTVTLQPHRQRWLFALDSATSLPRSYNTANADISSFQRPIGQMSADWQILAEDSVSQILRYRQTSILSNTTPATVRPQKNTLFLPGKNLRAIQFARQQRAKSSSDSDYATRVMRHFNKAPFSYTLQPQILGDTPVDEFLFDTREGFCEHYAAAFVVMMRAANIPARVVTGYQGGDMNDDYMIVRQSDAHAWTEAFIDGAWKRFDPTSAVAPSRVQSGLAAALPNDSSVPLLSRKIPGFARDLQLRWDAVNHHWQRLVIDFDNDSQAGLWKQVGLSMPDLWQIVLGVVVLAGLWSAFVLAMPRFGKRRFSTEEYYWQRLSNLLERRKMTRLADESQSEYLERAARLWPSHRERLQKLNSAFTQLRFQTLNSEQHKALLKQTKKELLYFQWSLLSSTQSPSTSSESR